MQTQPYLEINTNITLKPHSVQIHKQFTKRKFEVSDESKKNLIRDNQYNGYMSDATCRQVKKMIENWLVSIEIKQGGKIKYQNRGSVYPTFVTLTLPFKQMHNDNTLKRVLLEPMIQWLTSEKLDSKGQNVGWGVKCYLWRAETQKNGNLHFHIIVDRWIDMSRLRQKWNQILDRLGYVKMYAMKQKFIFKDGFVIRQEQLNQQIKTLRDRAKRNGKTLGLKEAKKQAAESQKKAWIQGIESNWTNPNSTDVHKLGNIKSISAYVTKYVTKKPKCLNPPTETQKVIGAYIYDIDESFPEGNHERLKNERKYVPIYEARKVEGRIHGRSDHLYNAKPDALKICAETVFVDFDGSAADGKKWSRAEFTHDTEILDYTKAVSGKVPRKEIESLNDRIDSDFIYIIPLMEKQTVYLKELSPELNKKYINHYLNLYERLYQAA